MNVAMGRVARFAFAMLWLMSAAGTLAQTYPSRPIKMIVPFPPGGGFDGIARPFAEKLSGLLGQPVILENRPGAGGNIGLEAAKNATADGYTLVVANEILSTNPSLYKSVSYDSLRDFAPISKLGTVPIAIAVNPSVPAKDPKELIALSRARALNYGTPGVGTGPHLFGEALNLSGVMQLVHVPYKGSGPAITDTIGGQIEMVMTTLSSLAPQIRAGKLRGIAVTGSARSSFMPDLPTLAEGGATGLTYEVWYGLFAPAATPEAILRRLNESSVQALTQPDLIERLKKTGYEPGSSTPQALMEIVRTDLLKWQRVVREAKITPE
jgi:tripartite-type tricarboxylate transporter receptor subunit TctC